MRRLRYRVAVSLDGFIAGPNGEHDWIISDPEIDFAGLMKQFDTLLVGRRTFEPMAKAKMTTMPGMKTVVFSRTLQAADHPEVTMISENATEFVSDLRSQPGRDIWLFGGAQLFSGLAAAKLVDTVELGIMPALLGKGIALASQLPAPAKLKLTSQKIYKSGIIAVEYDMV